MKAIHKITEYLENATLAELKDELELAVLYEDQYPPYFKTVILAELEKREIKKELEE